MLQRAPSQSATRRSAVAWLRRDRPHWWLPALLTLTAGYALYTLWVMAGSWLTDLDSDLYNLHIVPWESSLHLPLQLWVLLGQRAPAMIITGAYILYRARKMRSWTPLAMYGLATVGFVVSVMVIKYGTGRIGPKFTDDAHTVWDGGNIFPSGHVTGTVVLYGVAALVAPLAYRRIAAAIAVFLSVTVGLGTVALNTHWLSDVVGGWMDGAIVLLLAWALAPATGRRLAAHWRAIRDWHRGAGMATETLPFDTTALRRTSGVR